MSEPPEEVAAKDDLAATSSAVICWRCELEVAADLAICPHCRAQVLTTDSTPSVSPRALQAADPFKVLMWSYAILLLTVILLAASMSATIGDDEGLNEPERRQALTLILIFEIVDAIIVCIAIAMGSRAIAPRVQQPAHPITAWLTFVPMLALLLAVNYQYHWVLREILQVPIIEDELVADFNWLVFFIYCIQPAVVEELYCRGFALRVLRTVLSPHWAVGISAIMFGLMHVGSPLSMPYLTLVGVYLGYARVFSGSLALPILLHFTHNLVIILWK